MSDGLRLASAAELESKATDLELAACVLCGAAEEYTHRDEAREDEAKERFMDGAERRSKKAARLFYRAASIAGPDERLRLATKAADKAMLMEMPNLALRAVQLACTCLLELDLRETWDYAHGYKGTHGTFPLDVLPPDHADDRRPLPGQLAMAFIEESEAPK